jgi:3-ketosteroid 9alpha-monooxygenase subunit B
MSSEVTSVAAEPTTTGRRIRQFEVTISDVIVETPDTVTLVMTGGEPFVYKAGQFCTIDPHQFEVIAGMTRFLEDLKKHKEPPRAYSMASAPHEPLAITIKEETYESGSTKYPPLLSPVLVRSVLKHSRMIVSGFTGPYTFPDNIVEKTDHVVHIVAGSGSVPNWSMLKHAVRFVPELRHTFIYSNKTWNDVIFRDALNAFCAEHQDRVRLVHCLTRQDVPAEAPPGTRRGRVSADLLRELIPDPTKVMIYACGPALSQYDRAAAREKGIDPTPRFMESVSAAVKEIGVPKDRYKTEAYG